ncbi:MAG TPA: hypothetical protein VF148_07380 [Acidimicrobiia bacterium]
MTGFAADLADAGIDFHMEYPTVSQGAVEVFRLQQFEATYTVWSQQERSNN